MMGEANRKRGLCCTPSPGTFVPADHPSRKIWPLIHGKAVSPALVGISARRWVARRFLPKTYSWRWAAARYWRG